MAMRFAIRVRGPYRWPFVALSLCVVVTALAHPQSDPEFVEVRSPQLDVKLDAKRGLPLVYILPDSSTMRGAEIGASVTATVFETQPNRFQSLRLAPGSVQRTAARADFSFTASLEGRSAASFTLRYELRGAALFVSVEEIQERPGFELIDVATPDLATVREEDGGGWLAHGDSGGNLIRLSEAKPGHLPPNRFWFGVAATLPVVMIGTSKSLCVEEVMSFMDSTELAVTG